MTCSIAIPERVATAATVSTPTLAVGLSLAALVGGGGGARAQPPGDAPPDDAPPAEEAPEPPPAEVTYDHGFELTANTDAGEFAMKINLRVQPALYARSLDAELAPASLTVRDERVDTSAFLIRRARLVFRGHAFSERIAYKFETDFGEGFVELRDFFVDVGASDAVWVRLGQWKRPFSRQQITSSGKLELVERAITDSAFDAGRDIGVALHNQYEDSPPVQWAVGLFNGTGEGADFIPELDDVGVITDGEFTNVPEDWSPIVVGRVGVNHGGIDGYSEADLEGGSLRWAVAASVWVDLGWGNRAPDRNQVQVDGIVKLHGVDVSAAAYVAIDDGDDDVSQWGGHVQTGWVVGKDRWRLVPAARYAAVVPDDELEGDHTRHEITIGVGWFPWGHDVKLQVDGTALWQDDDDFGDELIGRIQGQLSF